MPATSNEEKIPEGSLRDVYHVLFRHKSKVILFFIAVIVIVTAGTFLASEIYRSDAKVLVRLGRESVSLDPTATTGTVISVGQQRENEIKSELEILNSKELVEKVVDAIGPQAFLESPEEINRAGGSADPASQNIIDGIRRKLRPVSRAPGAFLGSLSLNPLSDRDKAILNVTKSTEIEALKNSNIITVSFEAKSRKLAQETINKLIGFYLDKHINVHRTRGSYEFFNQQTDQLRNSLVQAEENLREIKNKTGIASLDEQRRALVKRIGDLEQELEGTESSLAASKAKVQVLRETLSGLPETLVTQETVGTPNPGADLMRARLYDLQLKEQELLSRFTENSKQVQEVRRQIAEAQGLLDKEERTRTQTTKGLNEAHKQVKLALVTEEATFSSLEAKAREQRAQLSSSRGELKWVNDSEMRLAQAQRGKDIQEANYRKYYEKLEQARIDNALEIEKISNISVVQPATYPAKPVRPRKALNLALGLFLGIFGGLGLAFFSEYMAQDLSTPESAEKRLGIPVLATINYNGRMNSRP
ncbi:MAG: GumC family protein [Pseudomonadota bacterium]